MNIQTEPGSKRPVKQPVVKVVLVLTFFLLVIIGPIGFYWNHCQAWQHYIDLLDRGQIQAARQYAAQRPDFDTASKRDTAKLEASMQTWTDDYLAGRLTGEIIKARINVLDQGGYLSGQLSKYRQVIKAEELADGYDLSAAIEVTGAALRDYPNDKLLLSRQKEYWSRLQQSVIYRGPVQHIFFHPLIAYPRRAFDGDAMAHGFNQYFVTIPEFNRIIEALYRNNYVLIAYSDIVAVDPVTGTLDYKPVRLPVGKKPLLLSIDDLNYYSYMIQNGTVSRLVLDKKGQIAAASVDEEWKNVISYDNEIMPILDRFVRNHPDFSYHGAKGIIALTGYQGVLGYRTNNIYDPNYQSEARQARAVIKQLKATGWSFASHGYGHLDTPRTSLPRLAADTVKWKTEVEPLVGPTSIYVFPFGSRIYPGDPRFQYLQQAGFRIFCPVGSGPYIVSSSQYLLMDRRHIDGISLCTQADLIRDLFDSEAVIDPVRPPY